MATAREGGFRDRDSRSGAPREGGFQGGDRTRSGPPREGGFRVAVTGDGVAFRRPAREGGFRGGDRDGGFRGGDRREGGFRGGADRRRFPFQRSA